MLYAAIFVCSYLASAIYMRRLIDGEKRAMEEKLFRLCGRRETVREVIDEVDTWYYTLGPTFLFGTGLALAISAVLWFFTDSRGWGA